MGSRENQALMMDPANCLPGQVRSTRYLLAKKQKHPPITATTSLDVSVQEANIGGGGIIHLQPGRDAVSGCLPPLTLHYPAERVGLEVYPAVFAPAQRFPGVHTAAADPRSAHAQTRAQMFHSLAPCGEPIPFLMPVRLQVLAAITSRCSGQVRH